MLVPIYQYYAKTPCYRYLYSSHPDFKGQWTNSGIAFYAYIKSEKNTEKLPEDVVAIYEYEAKNPTRYQYSENPNIDDGWKNNGVAFYAKNKDDDGLLPIYQYHADAICWRYKYSTNPKMIDEGWSNDGIAWYAIPGDIDFKFIFENIIYDETVQPETQQDMISSRRIDNSSGNSDLHQTIELSKAKTSTFEWGLSQSITTTASLEFEGGVPFAASAKSSVSVELNLGSTQTFTNSTSETISISETIDVPAGDAVIVSGYIDWADDIATDFNLKIRVSAMVNDERLNGKQICRIFELLNPGVKIEKIHNHDIVFSLEGEFKGSYALNTFTKVDHLKETNNVMT